MQVTLTPEQYAILRQLVNAGLDAVPDEQLTDAMLAAATQFNQYAIATD